MIFLCNCSKTTLYFIFLSYPSRWLMYSGLRPKTKKLFFFSHHPQSVSYILLHSFSLFSLFSLFLFSCCPSSHILHCGVQIQGRLYYRIDPLGEGAKWRRSFGQEIYSPLLLAFAEQDGDNWANSHKLTFSGIDSSYSLPKNVAVITLQVQSFFFPLKLDGFFSFSFSICDFFFCRSFNFKQELHDGNILLRLAHLYEVLIYPCSSSSFTFS